MDKLLLDTMLDEVKADIIMKAVQDAVEAISRNAGLIIDNKDDYNAFFGEVVKQMLSGYAITLLNDYGETALDGQIDQLSDRLDQAREAYKDMPKTKT